jgi:hypothetical protein
VVDTRLCRSVKRHGSRGLAGDGEGVPPCPVPVLLARPVRRSVVMVVVVPLVRVPVALGGAARGRRGRSDSL